MAEKEIELRYYIELLLKYKYLIAGVLLIFLGIGFIFYKLEVPYYSSSSQLVLDTESYTTKYNIKEKQDAQIISTQAKSYEIILQAVVDLDLLNYPIKPEVNEVLITKLKNSIPFMKKNEKRSMSIREVVQYYQRNVWVMIGAGGKVITIGANSQDPKISSKIANRIGEIVIDRNLEEKNSKIKKTLAYIENQIDTVKGLLESNRMLKEENERSLNYLKMMELQDQIQDITMNLNTLTREKEHLNTMDILTYNVYSELAKSDPATYAQKEAEAERKKNEIMLQKEYVDARIDEIELDLEKAKEELRNANKSEYYLVQDLNFAIGANQGILNSLLTEKQFIQLADLIASKDIKFLSRAYEPIWPNKSKGLVNLLIFFVMGSAVSLSSVVVLNFFDKRFKTTEEVEDVLNLDVLGIIPKIKKEEEIEILSPNSHPKSVIVEAYRTLRTNLNFEKKDNNIKTIAVTSARPLEGKTMTILNLASIMADSGDKVLVVDADLRKPAVHKSINIPRKPGLSEVLIGKAKLDKVIRKVKENMYVVPVGSLMYNPQRLLDSEQMVKFLEESSKKFDYVLCDTIPILAMSDAEIVASKTDGTIIVLDQKKALKHETKNIKDKLLKIDANILGTVVNKSKNKHNYKVYYYSKK